MDEKEAREAGFLAYFDEYGFRHTVKSETDQSRFLQPRCSCESCARRSEDGASRNGVLLTAVGYRDLPFCTECWVPAAGHSLPLESPAEGWATVQIRLKGETKGTFYAPDKAIRELDNLFEDQKVLSQGNLAMLWIFRSSFVFYSPTKEHEVSLYLWRDLPSEFRMGETQGSEP